MKRITLISMLIIASLGTACGAEKPPAPAGQTPGKDQASVVQPSAHLPADVENVVITYAGERGVFADTKKIDEIPEDARGMVRVTLLEGAAPPPNHVWVTNLRQPKAEGGWDLWAVDRQLFEELALGQGRSSQVEFPEGLEPPPAQPREAPVIVYKTEWCGVCKALMAYLDRKGVKYVTKDIEKDRKAAGELQEKSQKQGIATGSVPVIDVQGQLLVGFDRDRLEKLL